MDDEKRVVFSDADVILDFMEIRKLDLLERLFKTVFVTPRVDAQIISNRDRFDVYRTAFPIRYPEPEWEIEVVNMNKKYGRGVGEADRAAAIAAKYTGSILLTRDNPLVGEAIEYLGMSPDDFVGTVEILHACVVKKLLSKADALLYCDDITEKRLTYGELDTGILESLPD